MVRTWIINTWDSFRTSFWFVPSLLTVLALIAAIGFPRIDEVAGEAIEEQFPFVTSTPASARAAMGAIASAMVTVAGVVFSITVVALSMTSSQYGPRLLRNFMSNSSTQFAMGTFIATSLYSLVILREIRGGEEEIAFVPHLSVAVGVFLAGASVCVLIYFIHEVSMSVQAPRVIRNVSCDLDAAIVRLFPETLGSGPDAKDKEQDVDQVLESLGEDYDCCRVKHEGYLQAIETEGILELATRKDVLFQLMHRPGDFLIKNSVLAKVWPRQKDEQADEIESHLNDLLIVGDRRTPRQDVECAIVEVVEVAVRALSPGINDPFTAINCIDRLGASMSRLSQRKIPSPIRKDEDDNVRVIAPVTSFEHILDTAFSQIRRHSEGNVSVALRMLSAIHNIALSTNSEEHLTILSQHVDLLQRGAERSIDEASDLDRIVAACDEVRLVCDPTKETPDRTLA